MTNFNLELYVVLKWRLGTPSSHTELGTLHEEWIHDLAHCAVFGRTSMTFLQATLEKI